jgi:hypothetical protein
MSKPWNHVHQWFCIMLMRSANPIFGLIHKKLSTYSGSAFTLQNTLCYSAGLMGPRWTACPCRKWDPERPRYLCYSEYSLNTLSGSPISMVQTCVRETPRSNLSQITACHDFLMVLPVAPGQCLQLSLDHLFSNNFLLTIMIIFPYAFDDI